MSLSRRQFGKAALTSAAPAPTGVAGFARAAWAVSRDGLNWTPLNQNNPVVTPTAGQQGPRDPQVYRNPLSSSSSVADRQDGTFRVTS
ncbi:hypothetical protein ACFPOI_31735 [Nonomuraea angiospora]|uniref:Uncharacterized protein n=1 Tax=Nonomuraea angiospora TaxID=46172 RepID=A0ABR9LRY3_9ACTN|nr:hypothetical protein [Nonomuraea angiospora]MBE1583397.1 hypothetical protein [Nonomuraea angiospora]